MVIKGNVNRVLIIENGSVLDWEIRRLVTIEPELEVITLPWSDPSKMLEEVSNALPNVIVASEVDEADWARTSEILHGIFPEKPLRMIVIRLADNILEVYDKQCIRTTRNEDLLSLIVQH